MPIQRQAKQHQQLSVPPYCALLHTTARAASRPTETQPQPQAPVSATSEPQNVEARRPATLQQRPAASQEGSECSNEAVRDAGAQAGEGSRVVLYKGRYMLAFRMLVRFKIFQLVGIAALAVPINTFLAGVSLFNLLTPSPPPAAPLPTKNPYPNPQPVIVFYRCLPYQV